MTVAMAASPVSFEEYLDGLDEDTRAEWVNGKVSLQVGTSRTHQRLLRFLAQLLQLWLEARGIGGEVLFAPFVMRLAERPSGREPDLLYIAPENHARLRDTFLDGPADLIVEIVSPESRQRDREEKFFEYEAAGVHEYWIIEPVLQEAEFYRRDDTGQFRRIAVENGVYRSQVLQNFPLSIGVLWEESPPLLMEIVRTWETIT